MAESTYVYCTDYAYVKFTLENDANRITMRLILHHMRDCDGDRILILEISTTNPV